MSDEVTTTTANEEGGQQTQTEKPSFSPEQIQSAIEKGFESVSSRQQQTERPPTQDELDAAGKVWKPDKKFVSDLRRVMLANDENPVPDEELLTPFTSLRDNLFNQAKTYAENLVRAALEHIDGQYAPVKKALSEQQNEKTEKAFFTKFPALTDHKDIVTAVAAQFAGQKREVKNADEAFELLAKQVETVIKRLKPDFVLGEASNTPVSSGGTPRVASLSAGGQGGNGDGSSQRNKTGASSIWAPAT